MVEVVDAQEFVAAVLPLLTGRKITKVFNSRQARAWWRIRHDVENVSVFVADDLLDALGCTHWLNDGTLTMKMIPNRYGSRSTPPRVLVPSGRTRRHPPIVYGPRNGYIPIEPFREWLRGQAGHRGGPVLAARLRLSYSDFKRYTSVTKTVSRAVVVDALRNSQTGTTIEDLYPQLKK